MPDISRRRLLLAGMVGAAATALPAPRALADTGTPGAPTRSTITLTGSAAGAGVYNYHPFTMPPGVNRVDVTLVKTSGTNQQANLGLGIFDQRGTHYATVGNPNGFRGIFGQEESSFTITPAEATNAFIPGPLDPGTWTVIVPVFTVTGTVSYTITVTLTFGDAPQAFVLGQAVDTVNQTPGWYRGDLHCHTQASSDAFSSGSAMLPAGYAQMCAQLGLDFVSLTDHNVVSQNFALAAASAGTGVLVMAGEEMTNWFWGHATVSGLSPGDWVDWRQLPGEQYAAYGAAVDPNTGTIQDFIAHARSLGAFVAAAHPFGATLAWRFFPDADADPAARTDSLEVWTGPFQPDDQASVDKWDEQLVAGQRVVANGGSDLHGVVNTGGVSLGSPTTVVHAASLSRSDVIAALKVGRSFITRTPKGAECYVAVTDPAGTQRQIMGGTVYGAPSDLCAVTVDVRRAAGLRCNLVVNGAVASITPITDPDAQLTFTVPVGRGGYVRAELHGAPVVDPTNPTAGRLDMEALTNPVWLAVGSPSQGSYDATTPPPPDGTSAPLGLPEVGAGALLPAAGVAAGAWALQRRRRHGDHDHPHGHDHLAEPGRPRRRARSSVDEPTSMTHTEFELRAADSAWRDQVTLTGQVTATSEGVAVLSRWVPGCCGLDGRLDVVVRTDADVELGGWYRVTGHAEPAADAPEAVDPDGAGHDHGVRRRRSGLRATTTAAIEALARREL